MSQFQDPFVTVVSVGIEDKMRKKMVNNNSEYITVLTIGNEESKTIKDVTEEVIVYRLPGERLGFGLKFEGGTKAHEFVKRLFIQSCASDSPASRVQSSWGQLVEGDEVLKIDSIPVNSLTRIDCVRFLKDSNVAIKLLVKHYFNSLKPLSKSVEDIPIIVSTEEKKPPPVPPRKLHRKLHKSIQNTSEIDHIVPTIKQETFSIKSARLQSPRNSFKKIYSPDVCRRLSDGNLGPPDAEIYLDLISQESTQSLSESDDTGSTISTVLDRFASFPTTTTSSFAGSLPSTPISIHKQLDFSCIINDFTDDDFTPNFYNKKFNKIEENNNVILDNEEDKLQTYEEIEGEIKRPVIIPRSRDKIKKNSNEKIVNNLPRLVDFVPKSTQKEFDSSMESITRFLESGRFDDNNDEQENNEDIEYNMDVYNSKWILSSHLSTIGEDEEEHNLQDNLNGLICGPQMTPRVIIEETDFKEAENYRITQKSSMAEKISLDETICADKQQLLMEIPPSDSRQPPDGHEFPDFIESTSKMSLFNEITFPSEPHQYECEETYQSTWTQPVINHLERSISSSNYDLSSKVDEEKFEIAEKSNLLHNRSQSLIDMSIFSKEKSANRWNNLLEQRKSRLSKLKGLVIPEAVENDVSPVVNIPEIKNIETSQIDISSTVDKVENDFIKVIEAPLPKDLLPVVLPSWSSNTTLPRYSPAFKRKNLQIYPIANNSNKRSDNSSDTESNYDEYLQKYNDGSSPSRTTDDPKSLESIASPTHSDCSFEYISSLKTVADPSNNTKYFADSDNDSAVSSSQSSYNSRSSPPPSSPISEEKLNGQNRMLKPSSVEAINRKNILASAKCRSGKDLKIGSPVIKRKKSLEEDKINDEKNKLAVETCINNPTVNDPESEEKILKTSTIEVEVNNKVISTDIIEKTIIASANCEKTDFKPVPMKRTHVQSPKEIVINNLTETPNNNNKYENLIQKHFAYNLLEKRNKPVNVQSLKANFENYSVPVFPKNYKVKNVKQMNGSTPKKTCDYEVTLKRKSEDNKINCLEDKQKIETKRLSINSSSITISSNSSRNSKEDTPKTLRNWSKKRESLVECTTDKKSFSSLPSAEIQLRTITFKVDSINGILGITLVGGIDCENKTIAIHRIRYGSIAYQDGQLKKGDKVVSINGHSTLGLTHSEATDLLKTSSTAPFTIVIEESKEFLTSTNLSRRISSSVSSLSSESKGYESIQENSLVIDRKPTHTIKVIKDAAGLGFSIEGGKDSSKGDVPLVIKKIFTGGVTDKAGQLQVGDEILAVNKMNFQNFSRIEAWSQMKKFPEGEVIIEIYR